MKEWVHTRTNNDTTDILLANGKQLARIYGYHKNRSVQSITL